jgi:hypothetical protein
MTDEKIREVLAGYEGRLAVLIAAPAIEERDFRAYQHLLGMIPKMRDMLDANASAWQSPFYWEHLQEFIQRKEKIMRWLGFMQGALWVKGIYSIDEMRAHNKPEGEEFRPR